ncbi:hypothetical protein roselon_01237 [Roseibacterium elongatum DSM 19469]|uniref:Alpha 1,4-glycosyltransferase domain-containing protein n=1 Tax=Roseicyclus elongatus DSM 19469 TaxID=1294273 RepID=W8S0G1_9RHOB|nr:hypothetical protein [Roseibacterium elongatum]AHM03627.1 hypothetical protein roselon_01237 [Roseibacterium elongatum DSM 19469]
MSDLPEIASFWIGPRLRWIDKLSLASFVALGHPVTLFHAGDDPAPEVPDGVTAMPAAEVWPEIGASLGVLPPAPLSDVFRLHLMRRTPMIWADTDVIGLHPLWPRQGYLIGRQEGDWINNAVLRVPDTSPGLAMLQAAFADPATVFPWLEPAHQATIRKARPRDRQAETARLVGNAFGPIAHSHALTKTGEIAHALPQEALNPIPWWLGDLYFDPRGTLDHWVTENTLCLHLYASRIRPFFKRRRPPKGSPLARIARRIGFDDFR